MIREMINLVRIDLEADNVSHLEPKIVKFNLALVRQ